MKKLLLASVGLFALAVGSASAADMPRREAMPTKAPVYVSQMYNWTGPYIGINGGAAFSGSNGASGGLVGGTLGYNLQSGPLVWGIEGDLDWTRIRGNNTPAKPAIAGLAPSAAVLATRWDRPAA